jgi:hypothetical protein
MEAGQCPTRGSERTRQVPILRILVSSYFAAGAFGVIPGTDFTILTWRCAGAVDSAVAMGLVFFLGYLIMAGHWLRGAALTLGVLTFWSSYVAMFRLGVETELGVFWRDVALIAALMLTYSAPCPRCGYCHEPEHRIHASDQAPCAPQAPVEGRVARHVPS